MNPEFLKKFNLEELLKKKIEIENHIKELYKEKEKEKEKENENIKIQKDKESRFMRKIILDKTNLFKVKMNERGYIEEEIEEILDGAKWCSLSHFNTKFQIYDFTELDKFFDRFFWIKEKNLLGQSNSNIFYEELQKKTIFLIWDFIRLRNLLEFCNIKKIPMLFSKYKRFMGLYTLLSFQTYYGKGSLDDNYKILIASKSKRENGIFAIRNCKEKIEKYDWKPMKKNQYPSMCKAVLEEDIIDKYGYTIDTKEVNCSNMTKFGKDICKRCLRLGYTIPKIHFKNDPSWLKYY